MKKVTFYYDFISPYVWLAWKKIPVLLSNQELELDLKPVLFAGLLEAAGSKGPAEIPPKRMFVWSDVVRSAYVEGYQLKGPPSHPFNPLPALRLAEASPNSSDKMKLSQHLASACWEHGRDISDLDVLADLANELGMDGKALVEKISDAAVKQRLKDNTQMAIDKGVFGVPTFLIDDQLFWGHDRLNHLEAYLAGKLQIDSQLLQDMLNRPRAADRKKTP